MAFVLIAFINSTNLYGILVNHSVRTWANYVVFLLVAAFMMLPIGVGRNVSPSETGRSDLEKATAATGSCPNSATELGPCQVLRDVRFWALLFVFGVTIGADIGTTHTFSGVVQSRYQEKIIGSLGAIVFSSTDAFTRFASGVAMSAGIAPTKL